MAVYIPNARQQFCDANGTPLAAGSVGTYVVGTLTPANTWQDSAQTTLNANPIALDSGGFAMIYGSGQYRQIVKDQAGNVIWDRVIDSNAGGFIAGPAAAVAGATAAIAWSREGSNPAYPAVNLGGLWPTDKVSWNHVIAAEFDATNAPATSSGVSPSATLTAVAQNKGTITTTLALQTITGVQVSNQQAAGVNFITYCGPNLTNVVMKGLEIDIQPHTTSTIASGFGMVLNAFTKEIPGNAIYIEGLSGGNFATGVRIGKLNAATGAGLYGTGTMGSLINTSTGTYGQDSIIWSNGHKARFTGTGSIHAKIYVDGSDFWKFVLGNNQLVFRDNTDATSLATVSGAGVLVQVGGIGYATGAGGAATQATSKSTGVALNKICGQITLNNASLAANSVVSFTFTNGTLASTDILRINASGAATTGSYLIQAENIATGSCTISIRNLTAGALAEALVLNFVVIKSVAA